MKTAYNNLPVNRMQFYIITDSNGLFLGDKVTAHADVAALFNKDSLGSSVGDLLVLGKYKMVVNVATLWNMSTAMSALSGEHFVRSMDIRHLTTSSTYRYTTSSTSAVVTWKV